MLRCRHCGAEVSERAVHCPVCRKVADHAGAVTDATGTGAAGPTGDGDSVARLRALAASLPALVDEAPPVDPPPVDDPSEAQVEPEPPAAPEGPGSSAGPAPDPEPDPQPDLPSHRRWQPAGRLPPAAILIGCAVALMLITLLVSQGTKHPRPTQVLGTQTTRPGGSATKGSDLLGRALVYADAGTGVAVVPFGGKRHTLENFMAPGFPERPLRAGDNVVFIMNGSAYTLAPPFTGTPRVIGPADHLFPSVTPGTVGVYHAAKPGRPPTLEMVAVRGSVHHGAFPLDPGSKPVAELQSGVLMWDRPGDPMRVWTPQADGSGRYGDPFGDAGAVLATSGDRVAWVSSTDCTAAGECPLHVTDAATGHDDLVAPPPGYGGYLAAGAFSPVSGGLLAAFVYEPVKDGGAVARLVLISPNPAGSGTQRWLPNLVPQGQVPLGRQVPASVVWTRDGSRLLFCGASGVIRDYVQGAKSSFATEQAASYSFTVMG